jgi:ADP-ribose pyrophosphatase
MPNLDEKIIATDVPYMGDLVDLHVLTIELPDGTRTKREVVQHPGAVAIVPLIRQDDQWQVLLVRQFRTAANRPMLEIPAGTLEPGESPEPAAVRELQEEIGYKPGQLESMGGEYTAPGYTTEFIHIYLATDLTESRLMGDADEFIEVVRLPLDEAVTRVVGGEIQDGKTIIGVLLAARRVG